MNYYNYHIGDYRTATAHLSLEEDATYKRLIDYQYDKEAPIPDDAVLVARRLRTTEALVKDMLSEFFTLTDAGWVNRRVMNEVQIHQEFIQKQKENGQKGGKISKRQAVGKRSLGEAQASQLPITNSQLPNESVDWTNLPAELATDSFKNAWLRFLAYRKERKKQLFPSSFLAKWNQMREWGVEEAIKAIDISIANGWQGIFPPDKQQSKPEKSPEQSKYRDAF